MYNRFNTLRWFDSVRTATGGFRPVKYKGTDEKGLAWLVNMGYVQSNIGHGTYQMTVKGSQIYNRLIYGAWIIPLLGIIGAVIKIFS